MRKVMVKKAFVAATGAAGVALVLASSAFACTYLKGRVTVTGVSTGVGVGDNSAQMRYCFDPALAPNPSTATIEGTRLTTSVDPATGVAVSARVWINGTSFTLTAAPESGHVAPYTDCNDQLPDGSGVGPAATGVGQYDINYLSDSAGGDCMSGGSNGNVRLGGTDVVNGSASVTITPAVSLPPGPGKVCISMMIPSLRPPGTGTGMAGQVPVNIV